MDMNNVPRKLWEHTDPKSTSMYKLMQEINKKQGVQLRV
jgi:acetoacetyl-CoA synthetase